MTHERSLRSFGRAATRVALLALLLLPVACGGDGGHDHDHADHDHADHDHSHGHAHTAPHGGALAVIGDEFAHIEWVGDPATGAFTVYVLDREAVGGVPIDLPELRFTVTAGEDRFSVTAAASANPLSGEMWGTPPSSAGNRRV